MEFIDVLNTNRKIIFCTFHIQHWVLFSAYSLSVSSCSQVDAFAKTIAQLYIPRLLLSFKRSDTSIFSFCYTERTDERTDLTATPLKEVAAQGTADTHADARIKIEDTIFYCVQRCCQTLTVFQNTPWYKFSNQRCNTAHSLVHTVEKCNK